MRGDRTSGTRTLSIYPEDLKIIKSKLRFSNGDIGLQISELNLTRHYVFNADEVFLTGTGAELVPVVKVDGRVIGGGSPGPVTRDLVKRYHELVNASGEPIFPAKKRS